MAPSMTQAQARKALKRALRAQGRSQVWLAGLLGVGQPAVSGWVSGRYRPDHQFRRALDRLLGIPADAWMTAAERRVLDSVAPLSTGTDD